MARKLPPIQLSKLIGGVHSQEAEARGDVKLSPDRCLSALNVEEKDGYLKRRPAFHSIAHGPQFNFPAGQVVVYYGATTSYDRTISLAGSSITSGYYIYIGCDNQFDGIHIPELSITTTGFSSHGYIKVEWAFDSSNWEECEGVVDFTRGRCVNGSDVWIHTLTQPGTIAWHSLHNNPEEYTGGLSWGTTTPSGLPASKYWVRLSIVDGAGTAQAFGSSDTLTISQPGIHCFELEPVNSILPARYRNGRSVLFFGGDRSEIRGLEKGANLSAWTQTNQSPRIAFKVAPDVGEGAALWNDYDQPSEWLYGDASVAIAPPTKRIWPGNFNSTGVLTTSTWISNGYSTATSNRLIKTNQTYNWYNESVSAAEANPSTEFRGGCLRYHIQPSSVTSNDATTNRLTVSFSAADLNVSANELEHCFIRVAEVAGAETLGDESQIVSNTTTQIVAYPTLSGLPTTGTVFNIYAPHCKVQYAESVVSDFNYYNTKQYIQFNPGALTTWPFNWAQQADGWYHFYVGKELQWEHNRGLFWNSVYDPVSAKHILTNGRGPLLEWDGRFFRELQALTDPDSVKVQQYTTTLGAFDDVAEANQATDRFVKGALHATPPKGKYLASFGQKLVVADDKNVYWSVAYDTDVWPRKFEQEIRDPMGNNITGMEVVGDRIVVFTPTAIFSSPYGDQAGMLNFQLESTGIGFTSGRAVAKIYINGAPALIGPTADGVRIYSPGSANPIPVIDDWSQVLPGGVNQGLLFKCVGAASKFELRYYIAVPRAGFTTLDTILVFDLVTKAWWVWRFPGPGISCISRDYDEAGNERMLFGGSDGMVSVLREQEYDFGRVHTNSSVPWQATSPVIDFRGTTTAPVALLLRGEEANTAMNVTTYINSRVSADDTAAVDFDDGSVQYSAAVDGTSSYSDEGDLVTKVNLSTGTRCTSFQYKLHGTGRFVYKGGELMATPKGQRGKQ